MCFISNNWLLFLSHLSTNEDLGGGDPDLFLKGKKAGVKTQQQKYNFILCVCVCVNVKERKDEK